MGLFVYLFGAAGVVVVLGWALYVLPVSGPLPPLALAAGMLPALVIILAVFLAIGSAWALLAAGRAVFRAVRRRRPPPAR